MTDLIKSRYPNNNGSTSKSELLATNCKLQNRLNDALKLLDLTERQRSDVLVFLEALLMQNDGEAMFSYAELECINNKYRVIFDKDQQSKTVKLKIEIEE